MLEVLVTVGLAAILAGAGAVRLVEIVESARLASGVRALAAELRLARGRALAGGATIEARFDTVRSACDVRDRRAVLLATRLLPPGVVFAALPARGRILFGANGSGENGTIRLAAGARSRSVVVNQRGRVRLQ